VQQWNNKQGSPKGFLSAISSCKEQ